MGYKHSALYTREFDLLEHRDLNQRYNNTKLNQVKSLYTLEQERSDNQIRILQDIYLSFLEVSSEGLLHCNENIRVALLSKI